MWDKKGLAAIENGSIFGLQPRRFMKYIWMNSEVLPLSRLQTFVIRSAFAFHQIVGFSQVYRPEVLMREADACLKQAEKSIRLEETPLMWEKIRQKMRRMSQDDHEDQAHPPGLPDRGDELLDIDHEPDELDEDDDEQDV